jgi:hypothetical protein
MATLTALPRSVAALAALLFSLMLGLALVATPAFADTDDDDNGVTDTDNGVDDDDDNGLDDDNGMDDDDDAVGDDDDAMEDDDEVEAPTRVDAGAGGAASGGTGLLALALGGFALAAFGGLAYRRSATVR